MEINNFAFVFLVRVDSITQTNTLLIFDPEVIKARLHSEFKDSPSRGTILLSLLRLWKNFIRNERPRKF